MQLGYSLYDGLLLAPALQLGGRLVTVNDKLYRKVRGEPFSPRSLLAFVRRMGDVLEVYELLYGSRYPTVCMDESSKQLIAVLRLPVTQGRGRVRRVDYKYE